MAHVLVTLHLDVAESLETGRHQVSCKHTKKTLPWSFLLEDKFIGIP